MELRHWPDFVMRVLQFVCEGSRADAPQRSLIDRSLFLSFPTTKLSRVTFEFLSVSSEGIMVLYRRDLVYVYLN